MASKRRTVSPQHPTAVPVAAGGAGAVFRRIGTRIGLLDLDSPEVAAEAQVTKPENDAVPPEETVSPAAHEQSARVTEAALDMAALSQELESLSRGLAGETTTLPAAPAMHSVLAQKKIAVIGLEGVEQEALQALLKGQLSDPVALDHSQAALTPAVWQNCDLVIVNAPAEWAVTEQIDAGCWARSSKPIVLLGPKEVLTRVARVIQSAATDFIPAPWTDEYVVWRAAMLMSRSLGMPPQPNLPAASTKIVVVVADDDTTTRTLVGAMLSRHGMVCHLADNGGSALELVRSLRPDAAILDVSMPSLNGYQVLASIKQDPSLASTQVVLLTSRQTEVDVLQGFGLGADDFMTKPFSPMELAARIKRLLARRA
jgi:CheY-like chemotaxis protein